MKLTRRDLSTLLKGFPNIELSYEKNIHKKVPSSNIYLTIPKGRKYFAWFKYWNKHSVCFLLELDRYKKNIQTIFIKNACFDDLLCSGKGTIFYGTMFHVNSHSFFNIEDIFYFKGNNLSYHTQFKKFNVLKTIMTNYIKPCILNKSDIAFGLPLIDTNHTKLMNKIENLPYSIYCIQHRLLHKKGSFLNERVVITPKYEYTFLIKATIHPDIYELYYKQQGNLVYYKTASIPDFKTSVFMNGLFRNIKENTNLDLLEESDDEEEFENISDDKYVDLEISIGDYIISNGELSSMIIFDSIARLVPGVLNDLNSAMTDSFVDDLLDAPYFTRPNEIDGLKVPDVLLSGNHKSIEDWKNDKKIEDTKNKRPDLWKKYKEKKK